MSKTKRKKMFLTEKQKFFYERALKLYRLRVAIERLEASATLIRKFLIDKMKEDNLYTLHFDDFFVTLSQSNQTRIDIDKVKEHLAKAGILPEFQTETSIEKLEIRPSPLFQEQVEKSVYDELFDFLQLE